MIRKDLLPLRFYQQLLKSLQLSPGVIDLESGIVVSNYKFLGDVIQSPNTLGQGSIEKDSMLTSYLEVSERNEEKQYSLGKCFPGCFLVLATALEEIRYTWPL